MQKIVTNVQTGEQKIIDMTAEEIAAIQVQHQEWLAAQPTKEEQIAVLQAQIDAIKGI
jgi:ABC-type transporter MlaC component